MVRQIADEEPSKNCGIIYVIVHERTGKRYVGATRTRLSMRMRGHLGPLNNGKHPIAEFQEDWNQDGPDAFYVEVIERDVPFTKLRDVEQAWIERYREENGVYNRTRLIPPFRFGQSVFIGKSA